VKDAETIEAVNGFGDDKWIDGIFAHPLCSLIPRGSTGISSQLRHPCRNPEPEWRQWLRATQSNEHCTRSNHEC